MESLENNDLNLKFEEYKQKSELLLRDNFINEALIYANKALEIYPKDYEALDLKVSCEMLLNQWGDVIETYGLILECDNLTDSEMGSCFTGMGVVFFKLSKYRHALECFDSSIELIPDDFSNYEFKANLLESCNNYNEAILCYEKAIELLQNDNRTDFKGNDIKDKLDYLIYCKDNCIAKWDNSSLIVKDSSKDNIVYDKNFGYCFRCGSKLLNDNVSFCSECGQNLNEQIIIDLDPEIKDLVQKLKELSYTYEEILHIIVLSEYYKDYWRKEQRRIIQTLETYRYSVGLLANTLAYGEKYNLTWSEVSKLIANSYSPEELDRQREEQLKALYAIRGNLENLEESIEDLNTSFSYHMISLNQNLNEQLGSINANIKSIRDTTNMDFFFKHMWNRGKL